jgi:Uma2 family endonuclease
MVARERLMTVREFETYIQLAENRDRHFELIEGVIIEKMAPAENHGMIALFIGAEILNFSRRHQLGGRAMVEASHKSTDDKNVRQPDVSYLTAQTIGNRAILEEGAIPTMPDLAVEIKSPSNSHKELVEKATYYLEHGTKIVWVILPEQQTVEVYTRGNEQIHVERLDTTGVLSGGAVLPAFTLPVADIFAL